MINKETLKICEELKKQSLESEDNFINKKEYFISILKENKIKIKDLFLKAIQEIPIDKLNIIKVEKEDFRYSAYKISVDTEIGNIEYRYLEQKDIYTSMSGLHCIFFSENYSLEDVMTKSEKEEILNFMLIMEKYLCYKDDLQGFNDKSQKFVEKAKQIEGNNGL